MTKLVDLDGTFVRHTSDGNFEEVAEISRANGLLFDCPLCGRHSILCWDHSVPPDVDPKPGRWTISGTSIADVTLQPSVNLDTRPDAVCKWHGWVRNGDAT